MTDLQDLTQYVLANSHVNFGTSMPISIKPIHHPSLIGRIFDVLSRPNYAVANAAHYAYEGRNPLTGIVRGLAGTEKETFHDVLANDLNIKNKWVSGLGGAALDIALDPTTYIGPNAIKKGADLLKAGKETVRELPKTASLLNESDPAYVGFRDVGYKSAENNAFSAKYLPSIMDGTDTVSSFFKGAAAGTPLKTIPDNLSKERKLIESTSSVVPDATPKILPDVGPLSTHEQTLADLISGHTIKDLQSTGGTLNPKGQLNIWKALAKNAETIHAPKSGTAAATKAASNARFESTLRMYKAVENSVQNAGHDLTYWDKSNLKLTDVIAELTHGSPVGRALVTAKEFFPALEKDLIKRKGLLENPDVAQAVHNVRVRSALLDSPAIHEAITKVLGDGNTLSQFPASQAHISKIIKQLPKMAESQATALGVSGAGVDAAKNIIQHMKTTVSQAKLVTKQELADTKKLGKAEFKKAKEVALHYNKIEKAYRINEELTAKIKHELEIHKDDYEMPIGDKGKVSEAILGRMFSWYGQKDLRPITEQHLLAATNSAWLRYASLKTVAENFSREDQLHAMRYALGVPTAKPTQLGLAFKANLENLFKGTGLTPTDWQEATVATRAPLLKERLNKHLKAVGAPWKFTDKKVTHPITGQVFDFSGDANWLTSWQTWDVKEPLQFFNKIQSAVEQSVHEKAIFDEIGERFGSQTAGDGFNVTINHPYLNGYRFNEEIAKQIHKVIKDVDTFFTHGYNTPFLKTFDKISRAWKYTVTLPNPSHHIHNLLGDTYLSWMAGVNSVVPYQYAAQILRTQRNVYKDLANVERLVDVNAIPKAMGKVPDAKDVLFRNSSGHPFSAEQIYIAANSMGILPQAHVVEDIMGGNQALTNFKPFHGKLRAGLEHFSEIREHFARLAHFTDIVKKSKGTDFQNIFRKAGYEVRKWHPDYLTLTPFEKRFMRRIMPFYSWTRRAIPLVLESVVMNPGKTLVYPKIMQGVQESMGINSPGRDDPFPVDQGFPQWIRDRGIGPVFDKPELGARNTPPGDTVVNPSNPLLDLFGQFSSPVSGFGSMLSPAIKIPVELLSGKQLFNNAPINSNNFSEYVGNQLPYFPLLQGMFGVTPTLGQTSRAQKEGNVNTERIVNWLTGLGIRGTGPYIKQSEFEQKQRNGG